MKRNYFYVLPLVAGVSFLSSCDKKTQEQVTDKAEALSSKVESAVTAVLLKAGSALEASEKLGFAAHLPVDSEFVAEVYNVQGALDRFLGSKIGGFVKEVMKEEGESLDDILADPSFQMAMEVLGEEIFFATGKGSTAQLGGLMQAYNQFNVASMVTPVEMLLQELGSEASDDLGNVLPSDFFESAEGKKFLDNLAIVPTYLGVKVSDTDKRSGFLSMIQAQLAQVLEDQKDSLEAVTKEVNGEEFQGAKVTGATLAQLVKASSYDELVDNLGEESADAIVAAVEQKDVVALVGSVGDYIVLFMGSSADELAFAESKTQSFLAREDVSYLGNHGGDDVLGFMHASEELVKSMMPASGTLESMVSVLKPAVEKANLGDTKAFFKALDDVVSAEKGYYQLMKPYRSGVVAHFEEGLKIHSYGGEDVPFVNLDQKRKFAGLESKIEPVFFANWVGEPEDSKLLLNYFESMGLAAYEGATILADLGADGGEFASFQQMFTMFNTMAKDDSLAIWEALAHDLSAGLGAESAVIIDLKGEMPTVPMIPQPLLKMAIPRVACVHEVKDRAKLAESWTKLNGAAENLLKIGSQMSGQNIPMQKPSKSRADGLTTWSFPIPMTTDNCKPCVSVSDSLFMMSSSPEFSEQIAETVGESGAAGSHAVLNFNPLYSYAGDWLKVVNENAEEMMGESDASEFKEEIYPMAEKFLEAASDLEQMTVKTDINAGEAHSVIHFKTRK